MVEVRLADLVTKSIFRKKVLIQTYVRTSIGSINVHEIIFQLVSYQVINIEGYEQELRLQNHNFFHCNWNLLTALLAILSQNKVILLTCLSLNWADTKLCSEFYDGRRLLQSHLLHCCSIMLWWHLTTSIS